MPSDVRSYSSCLPVHERNLSPQLDDATPPSDFSAPYPSAPSSPAPGLPIHQLAPDVADSPQRSPSSDIKVSVSPPGSLHLMDSQEEFTPVSNCSDPYPSAHQMERTDDVKSSA